MENKKIKALIAIILVITLTFADIFVFGMGVASYAVELISTTNHNNVQFSAYFITKEGEKVTEIEESMNAEDLKMYLEVSINNEGYFNGDIKLENSNFALKNEVSSGISKIEGNTITLNQITAGETIVAEVGITPIKSEEYGIDMLKAESKLTLEGTYLNGGKKDIKINAERKLVLSLKNPYKAEEQNVQLAGTVVTNKIYTIGEEEKRVVQVLVSSNLQGSGYPIKATKMQIESPEGAEEIKVVSRGTKATNGATLEIDENSYTIDEQTNTLNITIENKENNGQIKWSKSGADEVLITYILNKDAQIENKELKIASTVTLYDEENTEYKAETTTKIAGEVDGIIDLEQTASEAPIYKGNMYLGEETEFETESKIDVRQEKIANQITEEEGTSKLVENGKEVAAETTYKSTKINKQELDKVLGARGQLAIKDEKGTTIAVINSTLKADEEGNIEVKYVGGAKALTIEISEPEGQGKITLKHTMSIKVSGYSREQVKQITELKIEEKIKANKNLEEKTKIRSIQVADTTTYAIMTSENKVLSTLQPNNVVFNIILKTDNIKYDLYKKPTIKIELPQEIADLKINSINQLYSEEIKIKSAKMTTGENGSKIIIVEFEGEQTKYTNTVSEGIILSFNVDITFSKLVPSKDTSIKLTYTNENSGNVENVTELPLKLQSKYGIMAYSKMSEYEETGKYIEAINSEESTAEVKAKTEKTAKMEMALINNYTSEVSNVEIIGNLPVGEEIDTTFASTIQTAKQGVQIYYSEEAGAKTESSTWTLDTTNLASMKSYKIVIEKLEPQEVVKFEYGIKIGANTGYSKTGEGSNNVTYIYDGQNRFTRTVMKIQTSEEPISIEMPEEPSEPTTPGEPSETPQEPTTPSEPTETPQEPETPEVPQEPEVQPELIVNTVVTRVGKELQEGDKVYSGEKLLYRTTITNHIGKDLSNVKIVAEHVNGVIYEAVEKEVRDMTFADENGNPQIRTEHAYAETGSGTKEFDTIEMLANNGSITLEYQVAVSKVEQASLTRGTIKIAADDMEEKEQSTIINRVEPAEVKATVEYVYNEEVPVRTGIAWVTRAKIENITGKTIYDAIVEIKMSENLNCDGTGWLEYNEENIEFVSFENNVLVLKIYQLMQGANEEIMLAPMIEEIEDNAQHSRCTIQATVTLGENQYNSNILDKMAERREKVELKLPLEPVKDEPYIPTEFTIVESKETVNNTYTDVGDGKIKTGETTKNYVEDDNIIDITTIASSKNISATIENATEPKAEEIQMEMAEPNSQYRIAGIVWIDANNNGMRESNEVRQKDTKIKIIDETTGKFVQDADGKDIELKTDENGEYDITLPRGKYILRFEYDTENYEVTTYQKTGVMINKNSDVVSKNVDSTGKVAALTDTIEIDSADMVNIDMGIKKRNIFDLSLEKKITKVTVQNEQGTKTYEYEEGQELAKAEINPDYYVGSMVIVEYTMKVTNEGDVEGYVNDIIDYLPKAFTFNSELNSDWYLTEDGKLHNISLENDKIAEGETKEVKLILTKTLQNEDEAGRFSNTAEIARSSNEEGIEDVDSIVNNKVTGEDDMSTASIIISVTTGTTLQYIVIVGLVLAAIAAVVYVINKKIIKLV